MKKKVLAVLICLVFCTTILQGLPNRVEATTNPTAVGLTEFALKAYREGWGYVYGTYGQVITQTLIDGKAGQYPAVYSEIMSDGNTAYQNSQEWIGHRGADCVGLMKAYLWWQGDAYDPTRYLAQDKSANGTYSLASVKGPISTLPETHGICLWKDGHVGVYIGNGWVIEARGCEYGVVMTRLSDRPWTNWFQNPFVSYSASGWTTVDSQTYYYQNGVYLTGLQTIDGKTYLFGTDGSVQTGFGVIDGKIRYFQADGSQLSGWQTIQGARYYLGDDGTAATSWATVDGQARLFSPLGILLTGWQQTSEGVYRLDAEGVPLIGSQDIDGITYTFDETGKLLTGWQDNAGDVSYRDLTGETLTGFQLINGQRYWFDGTGLRGNGWQTDGTADYYFDTTTGIGLPGGLSTVDSQPRLFAADGSLIEAAGLVFTNGQIYLADATGLPLDGTQTLNGQAADASAAAVDLLLTDAVLQMQNQADFALTPTAAALTLSATVQPTAQLTIIGTLPDGDPTTWMTLDPSIATVDATGLVTATGIGQTLVILKTAGGAYAACQVTVLLDPATLPAAGDLTLETGRSADLTLAGLPPALLSACTLTSGNTSVATIDANGRITGIAAGQTTITIGLCGETSDALHVTIAEPLLGLSASRPALTLPIGATADTFVSRVYAANTAAVSYESSDPLVASVNSAGRIKGLTTGVTTITATSGAFSVSCLVTVNGTYPILRRGSSGQYVRQLQQRLADLGYLTGPVDGQFGPLTEFAVNCFQKHLGLYLTGKADHALQLALQADSALAAASVQVAGTLRSGDSGESVFVMQQRLFELNYLKQYPTGTFDDLTLQAIHTLQSLNSLTPGDIVDSTVISGLYNRKVIAGKTSLVLGDNGTEVLLLQTRLAQLKFYNGSLDGIFSASVELAVKTFQFQAKLAVDGDAGPITQRALFAASAKEYDPALGTPGPIELSPGNNSSAVFDLECRLVALGYHYAVPDNYYDSLTVASIQSFQRRIGFAATGVADLLTQARLTAASAPRSATTYKYGNSGVPVSQIQQRLNQLGFACGVADGRFGSKTSAAVKNFQRANGLYADGIVGSISVARLFAAGGTPAPIITPTPAPVVPVVTASGITRTLRYGAQGADVKLLQQRLNQLGYYCGTPDGRFGRMTLAATKAFQRSAGLTADGIVGSRTRIALFR